MDVFDNKVILITGGTGSLGKKLTKIICDEHTPKKVIIYSRDEFKQFEMQEHFAPNRYGMLRFFIGDVRDKDKNKWEITCEPLRLIHREVILYKICDDCPYNKL